MKVRKSIFCIIAIFMPVSTAFANETAPATCVSQPIFIQPLDEKTANAIFTAFKKSPAGKHLDSEEALSKIYEADINNDGAVEYVLVTYGTGGTMNDVTIRAFQKNGDRYKYLGEPPKPDSDTGDGPWYFYTYVGEDSQDQFLTKVCSKTYMTMGSYYGRMIEGTYLWTNNKTQNACDNTWVGYERNQFNKLYNQKNYADAYVQLKDYSKNFSENCKLPGSSNQYLWMQNDLALSALKLDDAKKCLDLLNNIKTHPDYKLTTDQFKKAVAFNINLCTNTSQKLIALNPPHGENIYQWVFGKPVYSEEKIHELLSNTTSPTLKFSDIEHPIDDVYSFFNYMALFATVPDITENRYALFDVNWKEDHGFIWIDTKLGTSLLGFPCDSSGSEICITSKNFNATTLPKEAKQAIKNLYFSNNSLVPKIKFYDRATNKVITLPPTWLNQ